MRIRGAGRYPESRMRSRVVPFRSQSCGGELLIGVFLGG